VSGVIIFLCYFFLTFSSKLYSTELATTPIMVVMNKIDLQPHISEEQLIKELNLDYIVDNPWLIISCSALKVINIEKIMQWLIDQADKVFNHVL
jgi:ADP-ribosylation factor-like protein 8